jgi:hypothetical protein
MSAQVRDVSFRMFTFRMMCGSDACRRANVSERAHVSHVRGDGSCARVLRSHTVPNINHLTPFLTLSRTAAMDGRGGESPVEPLTCKVLTICATCASRDRICDTSDTTSYAPPTDFPAATGQ